AQHTRRPLRHDRCRAHAVGPGAGGLAAIARGFPQPGGGGRAARRMNGEDRAMRVTANGIVFNGHVEGPDGAPWLVFSNSLACDLSMWDPQAAALKSMFRILRYDQRGHGGTEAPAGRYTFDLLIADAVALLDGLSIPRAHFAGLSMGGAT